ncbi:MULTISPECIES: hypothetical protein [Cupriavidus]|uniref:Uncharacterized protein n=1 Tax=Cupriavidus pauculus TaxID=82633 RepID=A0A5P2HDD9_9BURK|nr:hypothetical protein [Cupriavidus pauculus]QET05838.1 hypothetical protein FOB72_28185 [Cupriavidus pauculus]
MLKWVPCDSRSDMEARASGGKVLGTLLTCDANTWGYFQTLEGSHLNVGYANLGLVPQAVLDGQRMLVGINEYLVCYDLTIGIKCFSFRMPLVFHEFIEIGDSLIVRDEMGFVGIAQDGTELWKFGTEGVVESYMVTSSKISGKTTEGSRFSFELPMRRQ